MKMVEWGYNKFTLAFMVERGCMCCASVFIVTYRWIFCVLSNIIGNV